MLTEGVKEKGGVQHLKRAERQVRAGLGLELEMLFGRPLAVLSDRHMSGSGSGSWGQGKSFCFFF